MIDIATGFSMLPPMAWNMRAAMRKWTLGARLHSTDASVNSVMPVWNTRRLPMRSASDPESMRKLAMTIV